MALAADRDTAIEFFPTEVLAKMVPVMQLPGNQVVKGEPGCSAAQFAGTVFPFVCVIVHHSILPDRILMVPIASNCTITVRRFVCNRPRRLAWNMHP